MTHSPTMSLALLLAVAALAAAPASGLASDAGRRAQTRPVEIEIVERDGFRWADAGIGALAAVGVILVGAGVAVVRRGSASTSSTHQPQGSEEIHAQ